MYIRVFVTAGGHRDRVDRAKDGTITISVRAEARGGQANRRIVELLAKEFAVDTTQVRIISGHHGRSKIVDIET